MAGRVLTPNENAWATTNPPDITGTSQFLVPSYFNGVHIQQPVDAPKPYENSLRSMWSFEDAKRDSSLQIESLIRFLAMMQMDFLITKILPLRTTQELNITFNKVVYPAFTPNRVPQNGVVRHLSSSRQRGRKQLERCGIGLQMQFAYMGEKAGREDYANKIAQINISMSQYLQQDALMALVTVGESSIKKSKELGLTSAEDFSRMFEETMNHELTVWGYFQQNRNAFAQFDTYIQKRENALKMQVKPNTYILPKGVVGYLSEIPLDQVVANIYGPGSQANVKSHASFSGGVENLRGLDVYVTDVFHTGRSGMPVDPMESKTQIGELFVSYNYPGMRLESYVSGMRSPQFYSQESNTMETISLRDQLYHSNRFDLKTGALRSIRDKLNYSVGEHFTAEQIEQDFLHHKINGILQPISFFGQMNQNHFDLNDYRDTVKTVFAQLKRVTDRTSSEFKEIFHTFDKLLDRNARIPWDQSYNEWFRNVSLFTKGRVNLQGSLDIPTFKPNTTIPSDPTLYSIRNFFDEDYSRFPNTFDSKTFTGVPGSWNQSDIFPELEVRVSSGKFEVRENLLLAMKSRYVIPPTTRSYEDFDTIRTMYKNNSWADTPFGIHEGSHIAASLDKFDQFVDELMYMFPNCPLFSPKYQTNNSVMETPSSYSTAFESLIGFKYPARTVHLLDLSTQSHGTSIYNREAARGGNAADPTVSQLFAVVPGASDLINVIRQFARANDVPASVVNDFANITGPFVYNKESVGTESRLLGSQTRQSLKTMADGFVANMIGFIVASQTATSKREVAVSLATLTANFSTAVDLRTILDAANELKNGQTFLTLWEEYLAQTKSQERQYNYDLDCILDTTCENNSSRVVNSQDTYNPSPISIGQTAFLQFLKTELRNSDPRLLFAIPSSYNDSSIRVTPGEVNEANSNAISTPDALSRRLKTYGPILLTKEELASTKSDVVERWPLFSSIRKISDASGTVTADREARQLRETLDRNASLPGSAIDEVSSTSAMYGNGGKRQKTNQSSTDVIEELMGFSQRNVPKNTTRFQPVAHGLSESDLDSEEITENLRANFLEITRYLTYAEMAIALVFMMTPVTLFNCLALITHNVRYPYAFICARPHADYRGLSVIKCVPGDSTGNTFFGNVMSAVARDNTIGIERTSIWWYQAAIVTNEEQVLVVKNPLINGYEGGLGAGYLDPNYYNPAAGIYRRNRDESIIVIDIPNNEKLAKGTCLSGKHMWIDIYGLQDSRVNDRGMSYSTAPFHCSIWGFREMFWNNRFDNGYLNSDALTPNEFIVPNDMCFKSLAAYPDETGAFAYVTQQQGHWKTEATYPGCHDGRVASAAFKDKSEFLAGKTFLAA